MSIRRAALDSALTTGAKLLGGLVTLKLLALYLGAEQLGRIGNVFSAVTLVTALAPCGIVLGVTRYAGQYASSPIILKNFLGVASYLTLFSSTILSVLGIWLAEYISVGLFRDDSFILAIRIGCLLIIPIGYASLGIALINGLSETRLLALTQIMSVILGSFGLVIAIVFWSDRGAIVGLLWIVACPLLALSVLLYHFPRRNIFWIKPIFEAETAKKLLRYAWAMLITVVTQNFVQIVFRNWIVADHGLAAVGYWQSMLRISDAYLQVFSVFLVSYLLPRLSQESDRVKIVDLIRQIYQFLVPTLLVILLVVYLSRNLIVKLLLTNDFFSVTDLFLPQLCADFFRVISYVPGYIVLARGYAPLLILADPFQAFLLLVVAPFYIPDYGPLGACFAYGIAYFVYSIFSLIGLSIYGKRR